MKKTRHLHVVSAAFALLLAWPMTSAWAATGTWLNTGTDFNTGTNWDSGTVPNASSERAFFEGTVTSQPNLSANTTLQGLSFTNGANGYDLSGDGGVVLTLASQNSNPNAAIYSATAGTNTISVDLFLSGTNSTINQTNGGTLIISGNVTSAVGHDGLSIRGTDNGALVLSGSNSYTGNTTILVAKSVLHINHKYAISTGDLVLNLNGTIDNTSGAALTLQNNKIILNGANASQGNLTFTGSYDLNFGSASVVLVTNSDHSINVIGGTLAVGSLAADDPTRVLTKDGGGVLAIQGESTSFKGGITVKKGTLRLENSSGSALGEISQLTVLTSATVLLSQSNQVKDDANVTLSGGTIALADGISELFGDLNLTANSTLDYGSSTNSLLAFKDYTPTYRLNVANFAEGNKLIFATDLSSSVTNTNYFNFFSSEYVYNWDNTNFTVEAVPEPSTVLLVGLSVVALVFWRRYRSV